MPDLKGEAPHKLTPIELERFLREKYEPDWFVKLEKEEEQLTSEIIIAGAFKIMMQRESLAPEVRVEVLEETKFTLSKRIKGFTIQTWGFDPYKMVNYHHMLAVSLFLGQHDMHSGNWGGVEEDEQKWAAVIDHGRCIVNGHIQLPETIAYALRHDHQFEHLVTKDFAMALLTVANEAEIKKKDLSAALAAGLEQAKLHNLLGSSNLSLESLLNDIDNNIKSLRIVAFAIQIQIAIRNVDLKHFTSLMDDERFPRARKNWPKLNLNPNETMNIFFDFVMGEKYVPALVARFQSFRDAYLETKELCPTVNTFSSTLYIT